MTAASVELARERYGAVADVARLVRRYDRIFDYFWLAVDGLSLELDLAMARRHGPHRGPTPRQRGEEVS